MAGYKDNQMKATPVNDLFEMELFGNEGLRIAVPMDAPEGLKKKLVGALLTYQSGGKSVDYVIKKYSEFWDIPPLDIEKIKLLNSLRVSDKLVNTFIRMLSKVSKQPDLVGLFAAEMALIRLRATFRSALFLIMQGFAFEAAALCRIILEQYGFAYTASKSNDADFIQKINVTKTISKLKRVLPYAGILYGELSSQSHLDPKNNRHYIEGNDDVIVIRFRLPQAAKTIALYSMILAEDMGTIIEGIFGNEFRTVDPDDHDESEDYLNFIKKQRNELETELKESEK